MKLLPSPWWGDRTRSTSQPSAGNQSTVDETRHRIYSSLQWTSRTLDSHLMHELVSVHDSSIEGAAALFKLTWEGFLSGSFCLSADMFIRQWRPVAPYLMHVIHCRRVLLSLCKALHGIHSFTFENCHAFVGQWASPLKQLGVEWNKTPRVTSITLFPQTPSAGG